jgi:vanillate O-demethylase ferredoxin subunit
MHEQVHAGDLLTISEPKCHFALDEEATESVLLAGGIGITPVLAMAEHLAANQRDFSLDYFARSAGVAAFLDRIAGAPWTAQARTHFDDQAGGAGDLAAIIGAPHAGKHLYVCGPTGFLEAALGAARRLGWNEAHLHREYFSNDLVDTSGATFNVQIASSGKIVRIAPEQSIAAALEAQGIFVPTSCEQGVCGTCITRVLAGTPDHRDLFLTDDEHAANDCMTVCCSRSKSATLVLDL